MYETNKQIELANLAKKTFDWQKDRYEEIANNLLFGIEEEKKTKLTNYIKILFMSSSIKNSSNCGFNDKDFNKEYKHFSKFEVNRMCETLLAIFITLELSIVKSKELKTDLRLKLIEELTNALEVNNKELARVCHRALTDIIKR